MRTIPQITEDIFKAVHNNEGVYIGANGDKLLRLDMEAISFEIDNNEGVVAVLEENCEELLKAKEDQAKEFEIIWDDFVRDLDDGQDQDAAITQAEERIRGLL